MMVKEAIILAGGLGTRLRTVIKDIPKPMADINGKPFLEHLLTFLTNQNTEKIILSVGYKYEIIKNYFGDFFSGAKLVYSIEKEPLGTGGAIRKSLNFVESNDVLVLNGDTFFDINLQNLFIFHKKTKATLSIALKPLTNFDRYGCVIIDKNKKIIGFKEKQRYKEGLINGGIYLLNSTFFEQEKHFNALSKFSFEKDFLEKFYRQYDFYGLEFNDYFIDIGIPEDYLAFVRHVNTHVTHEIQF